MRVAAVLLGAGCLVWAALPAVPGATPASRWSWPSPGWRRRLRLALAAVPVPAESYWPSPSVRAWRTFLDVVRQVPWEEGAVIGIAWLEVQHPSRPWHTAVLGAGLIAYLLIVHLAESDARLATLRPQARVLGLGAVLLALGAGAGMLPAAGPGAGSALLRLVAAGALIAAAGLVLPYVARRLPRAGGGDSVGIYKRQANTQVFPGGWRLTKTWPGGKIGLYADTQEGRTRWLRSSGPGSSSNAGPETKNR